MRNFNTANGDRIDFKIIPEGYEYDPGNKLNIDQASVTYHGCFLELDVGDDYVVFDEISEYDPMIGVYIVPQNGAPVVYKGYLEGVTRLLLS